MQKKAITEAWIMDSLILTGRPSALNDSDQCDHPLFEGEGAEIRLAFLATGRAAKRMTETTGYEAPRQFTVCWN